MEPNVCISLTFSLYITLLMHKLAFSFFTEGGSRWPNPSEIPICPCAFMKLWWFAPAPDEAGAWQWCCWLCRGAPGGRTVLLRGCRAQGRVCRGSAQWHPISYQTQNPDTDLLKACLPWQAVGSFWTLVLFSSWCAAPLKFPAQVLRERHVLICLLNSPEGQKSHCNEQLSLCLS